MNKGFTLIELLAVIVILGILALIVTPAVLRIVNKSRSDSAVISAKGYIESAKASIIQQVGTKKFKATSCDVTETGDLSCDDENTYEVYADNRKPNSGKIYFNNKSIINISNLKFGKYFINTDANGEYYASTTEKDLSE